MALTLYDRRLLLDQSLALTDTIIRAGQEQYAAQCQYNLVEPAALMSAAAPSGTTDGHLQIQLVNGNHWLVSCYDVATHCVTVYDSVYTHAGAYHDLGRQLQYCYP